MDYGFETRACNDPAAEPSATGDVVRPLHLSTTFEMGPSSEGEYKYTRFGNPTRAAVESKLARLEGADHGLALSSGMAAISTVCFGLLSPGDHVVAFESLFGGTKAMFDDLLAGQGVEVTYVDATDAGNVASAMRPETRLVWVESPTNPLLRLCDVEAVAKVADEGDATLAVDNTFSTPAVQRPLELGADVAVYSTTKFLNGHSDSMGGAICTDDDALVEQFRFVQERGFGAVLAPFDCFLLQRGLKTLPLRMRRHQSNATAVAAFLADHPEVRTVHYPGLEGHPQHDLAAEQMDGYGGVVSFEVDADAAETRAFLEELEVFDVAVSLGGVESLIEHTASMSAGNLTDEERRAAGISESLVRAPIGLEDPDDLVADLEAALGKL
ncbi:PLP-dependent transferase [Natronomonas salina]|uniref:trans-sulfuration enzyme family protein n=1 Tax=Natronomonas salina TaxID=1710540 RepID=UPI0015B3B08F|nr:PLP-dependent aspartate aminotransferase family protein [Natronomonas salina]QLD90505.1 PLP-dependent transferase [Natronomonas salina]